jgi:hypothetical protein
MHGTNYLIQQQKSVASQKNHVLLEKIRRKQSTSLQPTITKRKKWSESLIYYGAEHLKCGVSYEVQIVLKLSENCLVKP